jgi:hypothetical protein
MKAQSIRSGCASVQHGDPMPPVRLTDSELDAVLAAARPLAITDWTAPLRLRPDLIVTTGTPLAARRAPAPSTSLRGA